MALILIATLVVLMFVLPILLLLFGLEVGNEESSHEPEAHTPPQT